MKRTSSLLAIALPPIGALASGLLAWSIVVRAFHVPAFLLPPPERVLTAARASSHELSIALVTTGTSAVAGFFASAIFGVAIAVVLSTSRLLERGFYPYAIALQTVPIVAMAPLLVLWLGIGTKAVVAAAFIVSVFPVIASTLDGLRAVEPALHDLFTLYGSSRIQRLFRLSLPHALPQIATGLRVACGLSVIGAIVGESVAGFAEEAPGLGIVVMTAYRQLRTDLLLAAILTSAALGIALFAIVSLGSWIALRRWHASARR